MKAGNLIRCANPPIPLTNETLGVIVDFDATSVTVQWPNGLIKVHGRSYIMWVEENVMNNSTDSDIIS